LRDTRTQFAELGAQIVAIAPHSNDEVVKHLKSNSYPFTVLGDPDGNVFTDYDVTSRMISLGQQPALFIVDTKGIVRFDAIGSQQWDLIGPDRLKVELERIVAPT
jgi:peroxiredoxin